MGWLIEQQKLADDFDGLSAQWDTPLACRDNEPVKGLRAFFNDLLADECGEDGAGVAA